MYGELPRVYNESKRKARKEHKCRECKGTISKGEQYVYVSGIWDEPASFKFCACCDSLRKTIMDACVDIEDSPCFGQLYDDVFQSDNLEWMQRYVDNAKARGGSLGRDNWMEKDLEEAKSQRSKWEMELGAV